MLTRPALAAGIAALLGGASAGADRNADAPSQPVLTGDLTGSVGVVGETLFAGRRLSGVEVLYRSRADLPWTKLEGIRADQAFNPALALGEFGGMVAIGLPKATVGPAGGAPISIVEHGAAGWSRRYPTIAAGQVCLAGPSGTSWALVRCLASTRPSQDGNFGAALAGDARLLAIAAPTWQGQAAVHLLRGVDGPLEEIRSERPRSGFAASLGLAGDLLYVGVPGRNQVLVFDVRSRPARRIGEIPRPASARLPSFGSVVSAAGPLVLIQSRIMLGDGADPPGDVDVFRRVGDGWRPEGRLEIPAAPGESHPEVCCFGTDGTRAFLLGSGRLYVFERSGTGWANTSATRMPAASGDAREIALRILRNRAYVVRLAIRPDGAPAGSLLEVPL